jgi:hypothetical protein
MIGYSNCGISYSADGRALPGCVVPYNEPEAAMLQYVMIDPGTPLPQIQDAPQTTFDAWGLSQSGGSAVEEPRMSNRELFDKLYEQNKLAFWIGGGVVGFFALAGFYSFLVR